MTTIHETIAASIARAFFVSAYADQYEEADKPGFSMSGRDFMEVAPAETDPAAFHAARTLTFGLAGANSFVSTPVFLQSLFEVAQDIHRAAERKGDRELTPEMFGHYLAMQAMGHGVGLSDAFGDAVYQQIKVPYVEFGSHSLERDYFEGISHDAL